MEIIWLSPARKSLNEIYNFYAEKNTNTAITLYNKILEEIDILTHSPNIGPLEPSLNHLNLRLHYLVVAKGRFKVIYETEKETIYIYIIWDCRQNPLKLTHSFQ